VVAPEWKSLRGGRTLRALHLIGAIPSPSRVAAAWCSAGVARRGSSSACGSRHLVEIDPRNDQLVAGGGGLGEHLAWGLMMQEPPISSTPSSMPALRCQSRSRHCIGARAHAELVEVEGKRGDRRVVADQDDLGTLKGEGAVALG